MERLAWGTPVGRGLLVAAALSATLWAYACGDGATEPPTPPPDPPRPTTVAVTPATAQLGALGATVQLSAEVRDQNGQAMAGATVTWASDATAVATVGGSGLVTAAGNGSATITATAGSASGTATVTVAQEVSTVAVSPAADTLVTADTLRLAAEAADANGHPVPEAEFSWASSDTLVAVVDDAGLLTGVGAGEVEVTATAAGVTGRAALTVVVPAPTTVAVTPDTLALTAIGQTAQLTAEVRDQAGRAMGGVPVTWSSADTTVAAVDPAGSVTAAGSGTTTVTATADSASGEAVVTVMQSAGSVVVSPPADTVAPGDTLRLVAEAFDENGHRVEGAKFTWSSSNASVATVDATGLVTGVAEGTAMITATTGDASGTSAITVENPDRGALVALYEATDGPNWVNNENWLTDAPLGDWHGVETDGDGRVSSLRLPGNNLIGPIPPDLSRLANLYELYLQENELQGPIPPELGSLDNLEWLILAHNNLSGPIPPELGSSSLYYLHLANNDLTGTIPPQLGGLSNLNSLFLYDNHLAGSVPAGLLEVALEWFWFQGNDGLCAPGTARFAAWLGGIDNQRGGFCSESDRAVLESLYGAAGGGGWVDSDGWFSGPVLDRWHGVRADSLGRVAGLDLSRNGLAGSLPGSLGYLARMTELRIGNNPGLAGRLPPSLSRLSLQVLQYADTGLCTPVELSFRQWLNGVPSHEGTGRTCAPLSERDFLTTLYDATGGPDWTNNDGWLTEAPLGEWYGVLTDDSGRVVRLYLQGNSLSGPIPAELGNLTGLVTLQLSGNQLTGPIPPELGSLSDLVYLLLSSNALSGPIPAELGNLTGLVTLHLSHNQLTGPIPPELGNLADLTHLSLSDNDLSGSIAPELGNLADLTHLSLRFNDLSGPIPPELGRLPYLTHLLLSSNRLSDPIPPELGNLSDLVYLLLSSNTLSGPIPPELGNLASLTSLSLGSNNLRGPIPPQFGGLADLSTLTMEQNDLSGQVPAEFGDLLAMRELVLSGNSGMSGALPLALSNLRSLERLQAGGTGLCAPADLGFLQWLEGVRDRWVALCDGSAAYLTQAIQSREFPVPLIAGEDALLRVFTTAARSNEDRMPPVRATFHLNGAMAHVAEIPGMPGPIPTVVAEGVLEESSNALIPGEIVRPGLEMVIEIDPDRNLDPGLGVVARIPETGRATVDVRAIPRLHLTVVPFLWTEDPDSAIVDLVRGMAADPERNELLWATRDLLPVGSLEVVAHEPVVSASNFSHDLLGRTLAIQVMEGGTGHYMGTITRYRGTPGVAYLRGRTSFAIPRPATIAHELGHNMSLRHAPCGGAPGPDPLFPYPYGSIGAWGYDFREGGSLVNPSAPDLMSYCGPKWISDYSFTKAAEYRLVDEGPPTAAAIAAHGRSLLIWGGIGADTVPYLEPAFVVEAPPALPDSTGAYEVTGRTAGGSTLFSLSFAMPEVADGDGSASFAFALPIRPGWEALASITLAGPGGSAALDGASDLPMAIVRDPRTGQVRGFLRDPPPSARAAMDTTGPAGGPGLEVLFSRGIPDASAWRR